MLDGLGRVWGMERWTIEPLGADADEDAVDAPEGGRRDCTGDHPETEEDSDG